MLRDMGYDEQGSTQDAQQFLAHQKFAPNRTSTEPMKLKFGLVGCVSPLPFPSVANFALRFSLARINWMPAI